MKKSLLFFITLLITVLSNAQSIPITANYGTSIAGGLGTSAYHTSEQIYTESELGGAGNFVTVATAIDYVAFYATAIGSATAFGNVAIYMQNIPGTTTTFSTGSYSLAGYTQVFNGTFNITATGWNGVTLTTPFTRTAGSNLQVLIVRTDNTSHSSFSYAWANGNNTSATVLSSRRYNGSSAGITSLSATANRSAMLFKHLAANDMAVTNIRALGKTAKPSSNPNVITAAVTNYGASTQNNVPVTLNITGANNFTDVQNIPSIAPGVTQIVTFANFNPTALGSNTVTVSVPSDGYTGNNSIIVNQQVTPNIISTAYTSTPVQGFGQNSTTGDVAILIKNASANTVTQVTTYFITSGQPYRIYLRNVSGGLPGTEIWFSDPQTTAVGANVVAVPNVAVNGDFFVVVSQQGTTNFGYGYEHENPLRTGTFFFAPIAGSNSWADLENYYSRLMVDVSLGSSLPVTLVDFNGKREGNKNILTWRTSTEHNNAGFEIQRSADGKNFSAISFVGTRAVNGSGNDILSYSYYDEKVTNATMYYRLKQVDKDGKATLSSNIVMIKGDKYVLDITSVYPNPARDNINLQVTSGVGEKATISLIDTDGRTVKQMNILLNAGDNFLQINVHALAKGSYTIKLATSRLKTKTMLFIKE